MDELTIFRSSRNRPERASPVVAGDRIYMASSRGILAVFDRDTGRRLRSTGLPAGALSTPAAVYPDSTGFEAGGSGQGPGGDAIKIYLGMDDGYFRCINSATGAEIWSYNLKKLSMSRPAVYENLIVFQSGGDTIYAFDTISGEWVWSYHHDRRKDLSILGLSSPLIKDGVVYLGLSDGYIAALDAENGREIWKTRAFTEGKYKDIDARLSLDKYAVYATSYAGETVSVSRKSGMVYWRYPEGGLARPCIDEKYIYIATLNEKVVALEKEIGTKVWETGIKKSGLESFLESFKKSIPGFEPKYEAPPAKRVKDRNWLLASEIVNSKIVVHDRMGNIYFLDPDTGDVKRKVKKGYHISAPMTVDGEFGYLVTDKGYLYKVWLK